MVLILWGFAAVALILAIASYGAHRWSTRRRLAIVAAWGSASAVAILGVLAWAEREAALTPDAWERWLPATWPATAALWLCIGWGSISLVWAATILRVQPGSMPPPTPPAQSPPPWTSNFVSAGPNRRYEERRRTIKAHVKEHRNRR